MIGQIQRDAAVAFAERFEAAPDDFAGGEQRVEVRALIVFDARRQDFRFDARCRQRRALQRFDDVEQRVEALARTRQALPCGDEASEHRGLDRFDLAAQLRERAAADLAEHARLAPFALGAARTEIPFEQASHADQPPQHGLDDRSAEAEAARDFGGGERAVRARVAHQQIAERIAHGREQRFRQSERQRRTERIAIAGRIFDGDEPRLARDRHLDRAPIANQFTGEPRGGAAPRRHLECVGHLGEDVLRLLACARGRISCAAASRYRPPPDAA